ncbi:MAG: hypothetical protein KKD44_24360 [Proteobacteria bacterium]|nr:hypothetical protein [Pseudomonadota bacterium]
MIIYLNPAVNNHTGRKKLSKIYDDLRAKVKKMGSDIVIEDIPRNPLDSLNKHIEMGEKTFIAGGGDGTVHSLANAMMELPEATRNAVAFGAIGLGSSNDFHKPMIKPNMIKGIPVKIDFTNPIKHNIAQADYITENDQSASEYFIINGSMGATADINQMFNNCDKISSWLKPKWVCGCIYYCGLNVFIKYKNFKAKLEIHGEDHHTKISNLGFLIYPNFAGDFKYDTEVTPQSDYFCVNLSENMNKAEQFISTFNLWRHKFLNRPKTKSWNAKEVEVNVDEKTTFEMDGEVRMVKKVNIKLIKGGLTVCQ